MTDLRQMILDRATALMEEDIADGETPVRWTAPDLAEAISELKWTDGIPHTCDLEEIAGTLNRRFKDRRTEASARPEPARDESADDEETANGMPLLLPIANMDGYSVDPWGRPHAEKCFGRKAGPLSLDKFFSTKGQGKGRRFVCGYRLRVGGKRKRYRPNYFIMARFLAEQKWQNGE